MEGRESDPFTWVGRVRDLLREPPSWNEVIEMARHKERLSEMRRPLAYRLEVIERRHELKRCPICELCRVPAPGDVSQ